GGGHTIKRRLQNRGGEDRQIAEEGFDSRFEPEPQPALEACFQKRGADLPPLRGVPGLLPAPSRRRHAPGIGARLGSAQTGGCRSGPLATQAGIRPAEMFRQCLSRDRAGKIFVLLYQAAMRKAASLAHHRRGRVSTRKFSREVTMDTRVPRGPPEIARGHESQIERWLPSEQQTGN